MDNIVTIVSVIVSTISLIFAITQMVRLSHFRKLRISNLRSALQSCHLTMVESDRLLNNRKEYNLENKGALIKIEAIHANSCGLIRSLFHELSQIDTPYDGRVVLLQLPCEWLILKPKTGTTLIRRPRTLAFPAIRLHCEKPPD